MLFLHLLKGSDGSYLYFINVVYHVDITSHLSEWLKSPPQETSVGKDVGEKRNPRALLVGMQTGIATVENSMEFPQKN